MNEYPLYPELSEEGKQEAQKLIDKFSEVAKSKIQGIVEDFINEAYVDIIPFIESDSWSNFRNSVMDGYRNYNNRLIQNEYDFKTIRQLIYQDFRDQINKDLDQDNLKLIEDLRAEIKRLEDHIQFLNKLR